MMIVATRIVTILILSILIVCVISDDAKEECDANVDGSCAADNEEEGDFRTVTGCLKRENERSAQPIYDEKTWRWLQKAYHRVIAWQEGYEYDESTHDEHPSYTGYVVQHEVTNLPGRGRGIVVKEAVKKGTLVWSDMYFADFVEEDTWKKFLSMVADYNFDLCCDVIQWAYVMGDPQYGYYVGLDLDEGSHTNHGGPEKANIHDPPELQRKASGMYAKVDLEAGDEVLADYTSFYKFGKLDWFEQSVIDAWKDEDSDVEKSAVDENGHQWQYRPFY